MIKKISISTRSRTEFIDITRKVNDLVRESKVSSGICHLYVPHTTAGITINENADPSVRFDILNELDKLVPSNGDYQHTEGNAAAHIKSSLVGTEKTIFIEGGRLLFGTWQGIFFCEFDGPRQRFIYVRIDRF